MKDSTPEKNIKKIKKIDKIREQWKDEAKKNIYIYIYMKEISFNIAVKLK